MCIACVLHVWVHIMEPMRQFEATLVPSSVPLSASVCVCVCGRGQRGRIGLQTERKRDKSKQCCKRKVKELGREVEKRERERGEGH